MEAAAVIQQDQENLLFYDIEVFKYNSFVVFKNIKKEIVRIFNNTEGFVGLADFIKGKVLVGYNNYWYDDKILTYMIELKPQHLIKQLNDRIISGENVSYINRLDIVSLDCFQQIDVSRPSLKKCQGNWGKAIVESSVDFSIDRPLTPEEMKESLFYCGYDVDTTIDIFIKRIKSYFQPKQSLLEMLGNPKAARWNTTSISAALLLEKPLDRWDKVKNIPPEMWAMVPEAVQDMWREKSESWQFKSKLNHVEIEAFDNVIQFGFGGLHGAHKRIKKAKNVKLLDVTSMYPNIILLLNVLGAASGKYKEILEKRIAAKKANAILAEALKLILNSVYGNLGNRYSMLFNQKALLSVCIYGQISLFALCQMISPYCTILNINTDGVAFIPERDGWQAAYLEWQKIFNLNLEEKNFDVLVQKDVNNYIAVKGDSYICKGGDVNRFEKDEIFKNNNARILDLALVNKLIHDIDIEDTFEANLKNPHLFQYILRAGGTYQGTCLETGELLQTKVNRVFASNEEGFCLFKKRWDDGLVRFADAPTNMFLHNGDCSTIGNFEDKLDLKHYYNIVKKRMERWI
jgi:hypothetical protein